MDVGTAVRQSALLLDVFLHACRRTRPSGWILCHARPSDQIILCGPRNVLQRSSLLALWRPPVVPARRLSNGTATLEMLTQWRSCAAAADYAQDGRRAAHIGAPGRGHRGH